MLKKSITYKNFEGVEVTKDFYFNLSTAELIELEMSEEGGLREQLQRLGEQNDRREITKFIKMFLSKSVGERDGDLFLKSEQISNRFMFSGAYDALFQEMLKEPGAQAQFIAGIMPADLVAQVDVGQITADAFAKYGMEVPPKEATVVKAYDPKVDDPTPDTDEPLKPIGEYTNQELVEMPLWRWHKLLEAHKGKLPKPIILLAMQRANETE